MTGKKNVQNPELSTNGIKKMGASTIDEQVMKEFSTFSFFSREIPEISGKTSGWRMKARLAVRGSVDAPLIGLFRPNTHDVIEMIDCPDHHPSINQAAVRLRQEIIRQKVPPYQEINHTGVLRYAQFFVSRESGLVQLVLVATEKEKAMHLAEALWAEGPWLSIWINVQRKATNVIFGDEWLFCFGEKFLWQPSGSARVAFHPGAFAQANLELFDQVLDKIDSWTPPKARLLEVYAGAGGIALHLAKKIQRATLIEENPYAALSFQESVKDEPFVYIRADAKEACAYLDQADLVIVDPPRKGLEPELLRALKAVDHKTLIYISCSLKSFEREAEELLASGWQIQDAEVYRLFPGTEHIEIAAKIVKKSG